MSEIDALLDTAFNEYNLGNFETAEELGRRVLSIEPAHGDALYLLGLIAFQAGALEPASKLLYQAVKLYPDSTGYTLALASVLHRQGHLDEALSFYDKHKTNPTVLSQMGLIFAEKGQNEWAKSAFLEALKLDKTVSQAAVGLAALYGRQGKLAEAETILSEAEKNAPSEDVFYRLAQIYRLTNRSEIALIYIEKALNLTLNPVYLNEKGLIFESLDDNDSALEVYIQATQADKYYADAFANLGNVYLKKMHFDKAEDAYKRALSLDKDFFMAHHNLASLLYKQNRKGEALNHYQEAVILAPKNLSAIYNLAVIQEDLGEYSEAAGLYFNVLIQGMKSDVLEFRIESTLEALAQKNKDGKKLALDFSKGWVKHFPDSVVAKHTLDVLSGKKTADMKLYSEKLYDVFADEYDEKMQKLQSILLDSSIEILGQKKFKNVLDLACGTGSFALKLKNNFNSIVGVDISKKMLDKASCLNIYDKLEHQSIQRYLLNTKKKFDLIAALDVTGYLDTLTDLFYGVNQHLTKEGVFLFSVENAVSDKPQELGLSGRYLYALDFVQKELTKNGLNAVEIRELDLRREGDTFTKGAIILAKKMI